MMDCTDTSHRQPRRIHPDQWGTLPEWTVYLGLAQTRLPREARLGRLAVSKRAGRLWASGEAIVAWLASGVARRRRREPTAA
jgi:hypothetical protein